MNPNLMENLKKIVTIDWKTMFFICKLFLYILNQKIYIFNRNSNQTKFNWVLGVLSSKKQRWFKKVILYKD